MKPVNSKRQLTNRAAADARPGASEYTLWDRSLNHFGLRVYPAGVRSFIVQIRVNGRLRKFTLGRYPATGVAEARRRGAELLARVWAGEPPAPAPRNPARPTERLKSCGRCSIPHGNGEIWPIRSRMPAPTS